MYKSLERLIKITDENILEIVIDDINNNYDSATFNIENESFCFRKAKKRQKKEGYFVALYSKNKVNHQIQYKNANDQVIIYIQDGIKEGLFIFDKHTMLEENIFSDEYNKGKIAFKVYPEWCNNLNKMALKTKAWQTHYFFRHIFL